MSETGVTLNSGSATDETRAAPGISLAARRQMATSRGALHYANRAKKERRGAPYTQTRAEIPLRALKRAACPFVELSSRKISL